MADFDSTDFDAIKISLASAEDIRKWSHGLGLFYLTIAGCPMKSTIESNTRAAVEDIEGVGNVTVTMEAMSDEQRRGLPQRQTRECICGRPLSLPSQARTSA